MPKRKATSAIPAQMQPDIDYMVKRYQRPSTTSSSSAR